MWSENLWILLAIAAITNQILAQDQSENTDKYQENKSIENKWPYNLENITKFLINASNMNSSQILFEDMLANSMRNFIPFSYVNKNCIRDGLQYIAGLNNQSRWAIQSK